MSPCWSTATACPARTGSRNVRLNFAQNLLRFNDERPALVFRNEWGHAREISLRAICTSRSRASRMRSRRPAWASGDRVAGFMPNIPETVIAMLAADLLGAIWSSCSPDFGVKGVVDRFGQIAPKVLFSRRRLSLRRQAPRLPGKLREVLDSDAVDRTLVVVPYSGERPRLDGLRDAVSWNGSDGRRRCADRFRADCRSIIRSTSCIPPAPPACPSASCTAPAARCIQHLKELVLHTDLKREDRDLLLHHLRLDDVELAGVAPGGGRHGAALRRFALASGRQHPVGSRRRGRHQHLRHQRQVSTPPRNSA